MGLSATARHKWWSSLAEHKGQIDLKMAQAFGDHVDSLTGRPSRASGRSMATSTGRRGDRHLAAAAWDRAPFRTRPLTPARRTDDVHGASATRWLSFDAAQPESAS
jgi:hypothetical protein